MHIKGSGSTWVLTQSDNCTFRSILKTLELTVSLLKVSITTYCFSIKYIKDIFNLAFLSKFSKVWLSFIPCSLLPYSSKLLKKIYWNCHKGLSPTVYYLNTVYFYKQIFFLCWHRQYYNLLPYISVISCSFNTVCFPFLIAFEYLY